MNSQADSQSFKHVFSTYAASSEVSFRAICLMKISETLLCEQKSRMIESNSPVVSYVNKAVRGLTVA